MFFFKPKEGALKRLLKNTVNDRISYRAAAFAYYALIALVPLLVLVLFVGGFLIGTETIQGQVITYFSSRVGGENIGFVTNIVEMISGDAKALTVPIIFIIISVIGIIQFFTYLRKAFFDIFSVTLVGATKERYLYTYSVTFLTALIFIVLFTLIISSHVMAVIFEQILFKLFAGLNLSPLFVLFEIGMTFILTTTLLTLLYRLLSCYGMSWGHALYGALCGSILFVGLNGVLGWYFAAFPVSSLYGAGGALVAFLFWVYTAGYVFFLGAEIAKLSSKSVTCKV